MKQIKRITCFLLSLFVSVSLTVPAFAKPDWPSDTGVQSEAGIVMDMDSGAVLFGQNIHQQKAPASITKLLTALIVIENANLDDMVTFSHDAVYNVESGSGNKLQLEEGDTLSVRDCLYVMLLQSSNQAANALAEHVAGSREAFVDMMNQKIAEIGCQESHFANPSGLNDETQRVSAYDMALIAREAFKNETLLEISSTKKASIPPTINNPEGRTFSMEHKLLITEDENSENYYPYAVAGKTGYTSIAGQTLVTYAVREDRKEVAVTLKSTQATHYSDTRTILDFGFARFKNVNIAENETSYVTGEDAVEIAGESYQPSELFIEKDAVITLPNDAEFSDAEKTLETEIPQEHPEDAVARLVYTYNDRRIGTAWVYTTRTSAQEADASFDGATSSTPHTDGEKRPSKTGGFLGGETVKTVAFSSLIVLGVFAVLGFIWFKIQKVKEEEQRRILHEKRLKRLAEMGCSEKEFERLLEENRQRRYALMMENEDDAFEEEPYEEIDGEFDEEPLEETDDGFGERE